MLEVWLKLNLNDVLFPQVLVAANKLRKKTKIALKVEFFNINYG
jgi:hypothetical protein